MTRTSLMLYGPYVMDRVAEAWADFNGIGWDEPGVVAGWITRYIDTAPPEPGHEFIVTDECAPPARAVYLGPSKTFDGHIEPRMGDFRIVEWLP